MLRFSAVKTILILGLCFIGAYMTVPNFLTKEQIRTANSYLPVIPKNTIVLGLDLQGGSYISLEVDKPELQRTEVLKLRDEVRLKLREAQVSISGGIGLLPRGVQVRFADDAQRQKAVTKLRELSQPLTNPAVGVTGQRDVDVQETPDGTMQLSLTEAGLNDKVRRAVDQAREIFERRVNGTGTTESTIQRQGLERIIVQVPGLQDPKALEDLLGKVAKLEFRLVADSGANPADIENLPSQDDNGALLPIEKRIMVDGADLTSAEPGFDSRTNEPVVNFRFNIKGAQRFGQVTTDNVGKPFAIVLDGKVISAPRIMSPITGGSGQISGRFTIEQVNNLSILLRSGALPARFTVVERRTVGAGLGQDSVEAGKLSAVVATALVVIFTVLSYGVLGIIAVLALVVNIILILGIMSVLSATLTLPGIAGLVLTVGVAVDSNVLVYERVREEQRQGRSAAMALDAGFARAFATIVDANVTMFLAGAILFFMGTGTVKGFAVTLCLGIITTVFTAFTLTRLITAYWYRVFRPKVIPI
jgi:protein-export membrane protein SecD